MRRKSSAVLLCYGRLFLCNMAEYLSDVEVSDDDFEYDGCPYHFEPEYTYEELLESFCGAYL